MLSALNINSLMDNFKKPEITTINPLMDRHQIYGSPNNPYKRHGYQDYESHYYHGG